MFLASQLSEISGRFAAYVQDIREFLLKAQLPVPSPDAIPQLSSRLADDSRFRADVGSLMRAILYKEREEIGYEDLLGILVAAAAGTEHDLKSDSQEADIREMLRFLLQSRRSTFPAEPERVRVSIHPEAREPAPLGAVRVNSEPVLRTRGAQSATHSAKLELRSADAPVAVAEAENHPSEDVVFPPFRTAGLFAAYAEPAAPRWRGRSVWIVGMVCILLGLGLGLRFQRVLAAAEAHVGLHAAEITPMIHRVVYAAKTHLGARATEVSSSRPGPIDPVAPEASATENSTAQVPSGHEADAGEVGAVKTASPAGSTQTASIANGENTASRLAAPDQGESTLQSAAAEVSSAVPVTVVKQVVTASPNASPNSADSSDTPQPVAATRSIVPRGSAGILPANVIFSPPPKYPAAAAAARIEGEVTVHAVVDPDGKVIYARAVRGPSVLRDAAIEAVQQWRYRPLLDNGKPIAVTTVAILDFKVAK